MIRHIVLLSATPEATVEQVERIVAELRALPALIAEIRSYDVGIDLGAASGNATIGVTADFDSLQAWAQYRDHPSHVRVLTDFIKPILANRTAIQFELVS